MYVPVLAKQTGSTWSNGEGITITQQNTLPDSHYAKSVQISWDNILYIHFYAFITLSNIYGTLSTQLWKLSTYFITLTEKKLKKKKGEKKREKKCQITSAVQSI